MIRNLDFGIFSAYIIALDNMFSAQTTLIEQGFTIIGAKGVMIRNPAALAFKDAAGLVARLSDQLGLNPVVRTKITMPATPEADFMDEWVANKPKFELPNG